MWRSFERRHSGITRVAGICGIFIPVVIFTVLGVSLVSSPWFNWSQHALSDLGIEENTAVLFNNGMIVGGILSLIFSFGLIKILSNKMGGYLLGLSSLERIRHPLHDHASFLLGPGLLWHPPAEQRVLFTQHCCTSHLLLARRNLPSSQ